MNDQYLLFMYIICRFTLFILQPQCMAKCNNTFQFHFSGGAQKKIMGSLLATIHLLLLSFFFQPSFGTLNIDPMERCYGKYGCFSLKYPWYSSHRVVNLFPKSEREIDVNYFLFTRSNRRSRQELFNDDLDSIEKSDFDPEK